MGKAEGWRCSHDESTMEVSAIGHALSPLSPLSCSGIILATSSCHLQHSRRAVEPEARGDKLMDEGKRYVTSASHLSRWFRTHQRTNRPQCDDREVKGRGGMFGLLDLDENSSS